MAEEGAFVNANEPYLEQEAWQSLQFALQALLEGAAARLPTSG